MHIHHSILTEQSREAMLERQGIRVAQTETEECLALLQVEVAQLEKTKKAMQAQVRSVHLQL